MVICITRRAFSLDSWMPLVFCHQKYMVTATAKTHRRPIDVYVGRAVKQVVHGARDPAMGLGRGEGVIDQSRDVLPGGNARDRAGEDVIEHQGGDADLGQGPAHGLLDHAVDAAADEHGAAFDVDGAHREGEQHDRRG